MQEQELPKCQLKSLLARLVCIQGSESFPEVLLISLLSDPTGNGVVGTIIALVRGVQTLSSFLFKTRSSSPMIMIEALALACLPGNLFVFAQSVIKLFKELFHPVSRLFLEKKWKKHVVAQLVCNAVFCGFLLSRSRVTTSLLICPPRNTVTLCSF